MARLRAILPAVVLVAVMGALTACGTVPHDDAPDPGSNIATGRNVFLQAGCGACHTLRDAGSTGTFAPNLDRIRPAVFHVREFVSGGGVGMPSFAGVLTDGEIEAVAEYVHAVAGY